MEESEEKDDDEAEADENLVEIFDKIQKNAILFNFKKREASLNLGQSKFGALPHLPPDFNWYYYRGKTSGGAIDTRPLTFLAQINLEETSEFDKDNLLPKKGMLYFFYETEAMTRGFNIKDKGSARVLYYDGETENLTETVPPAYLGERNIFPEYPIEFSCRPDLPDFEEFSDYHKKCDEFTYEEEKDFYGFEPIGQTAYNAKMLGYANLIKGSMLSECEKIHSQIFLGEEISITSKNAQSMYDECKEWILLLQLNSFKKGHYKLDFENKGNIYFYIKKEDLAKGNFENVWLILQSY